MTKTCSRQFALTYSCPDYFSSEDSGDSFGKVVVAFGISGEDESPIIVPSDKMTRHLPYPDPFIGVNRFSNLSPQSSSSFIFNHPIVFEFGNIIDHFCF